MVSIWFFVNASVLLFALWKICSNYIGVHIVFGALGLLFVLYNWTRHAVFSTIRSNISRKRKIKYANLSKFVLPIHKWTGSTALVLIIIHGTLVLQRFGFNWSNGKVVSGLVAGSILIAVVSFGWLRWYRTTVNRRYIHLILAYCLFVLIVVHLVF